VPARLAVEAEAAVLAGHPDAAGRLERAATAARENAIAAAVVERAADLLRGRREALRLGCDHQRRRTEALATKPK